jgi:hypothetical protein
VSGVGYDPAKRTYSFLYAAPPASGFHAINVTAVDGAGFSSSLNLCHLGCLTPGKARKD